MPGIRIAVDASQVTQAARQAYRGFDKISRGARQMVGSIGKAQSTLGRVTNAVFSLQGAIAGIGLGLVAKQFVDVAASFEQMELKLNALTDGRGTETLERINQWAIEMPVNTQKAVDTFAMMKAMGLDPNIEAMETLVDVSVLFGEDAMPRVARALGQMQTLGKLSAEELNQLSESGINARKYLKEAFGTSATDEIRKMGVAIEDIIGVIMSGLEEDFGGAAKNAMDTWQGVTATFESTLTEISRQFAEAGVFDALKESVSAIGDEMGQWLEHQTRLKELGLENWFDNVGQAAKDVSGVVSGIARSMEAISKGVAIAQLLMPGGTTPGNIQDAKDIFGDLFGNNNKPRRIPFPQDRTPINAGSDTVADEVSRIATKTPQFTKPENMTSAFSSFNIEMHRLTQENMLTNPKWWDAAPVETWADGAVTALGRYEAAATNAAQNMDDVFSDAFSNLEDAMVEWVRTGKLSFSDMIDSMIADIIRLTVRQSITGPLALAASGWMSGMFSGGQASTSQALAWAPWNSTGYDSGGWINEPVFGVGASGRRYTFAENNPEYVANPARGQMGTSVEINIHNAPPVKSQKTRKKAGGGERTDIWFDQQVAGLMWGSTETAKAIETKYGIAQRPNTM